MKRLVIGTLLFISLVFAVNTFAVDTTSAATAANCTQQSRNFFGFPTWYKYLNPTFSNGQCNLNVQIPESLPAILLAVFEILLRIAGMISIVFITYGGFQYLTTTGEPEKAKNARTTIFNALVGLMLAMFATIIVNLVARSV